MNIQRFINLQLQSNTYVLYCDYESGAWLVDPGDIEPVIHFLHEHHLHLKGILVTHSHFDHIYGINGLIDRYGPTPIYASFRAKEGFSSSKINASYYAEMPFVIDTDCLVSVGEGDVVKLWKGINALIYETPGHNDDCLSFKIMDNLFTGDALIPGVKVYTRSKKSNKEQALKTINLIIQCFSPLTVIYPGHKDCCILKDIVPFFSSRKINI